MTADSDGLANKFDFEILPAKANPMKTRILYTAGVLIYDDEGYVCFNGHEHNWKRKESPKLFLRV